MTERNLIVVSNTKDPYLNQALELALFEGYTAYDAILFVWSNAPTIVFGRHQNPWREIDILGAQDENVTLLRRMSGGGTVYHDLGNLNFSFIAGHRRYDEMKHFEVIRKAMSTYDIALEVSPRKDLLCGGKKVSGNAFYLKGSRRMHHGTLLVSADLHCARKLLKAKDFIHLDRFKQSRSVASVSSSVMNLAEKNATLNIGSAINAIVDTFYKANDYRVEVLTADAIIKAHQTRIESAMEKFKSWEWNFGETPDFIFTLSSDEAASETTSEVCIQKGRFSKDAIAPESNTKKILEKMNFQEVMYDLRAV